MFGYVKVDNDELRVKELRTYRRYYCGLCRQMANYSQISRLMLSYDMVFLVLLINAALPVETKPCKMKFFRHCRKICGDVKLNYIAAVSILLQYYKLQNDYIDGEKIKRGLLLSIQKGFEAAKNDYPSVHNVLENNMSRLYVLEKERSIELFELEDTFASIFSEIFNCAPVKDELNEIKGKIAYHVGAWVYWFDMLCDEKKDAEDGAYNVILISDSPDSTRKEIVYRCFSHLEQAEKLLGALPYSQNASILENVITRGLPCQMREIGLVSNL